ncbi:hypothetical protein [Nocardiopsis sp. MG754419]|uniref:hypothetical protein n=1 Tax=Nocardiopsis sp. MG754419 TaxID=2259865 RepID=UPI001BACF292|nr:hypothetical protein [Nocardiopsis sp. MG754419]MBR8740837.1 hypothetical protein [Nocardiopsis sp. MG754419]
MSFTDYSQNVRIRELEESLSSAHSHMARERKHMRSELSRLRGGVEQRLDRVSATLDAFIELSDLRVTLAMFDGAAIARHRTLQMIDGAALGTLELDDVPGYWLVPAARGLHALLNGDLPGARVRFDEAAEIDPERAHSFAALAAALTSAEHARALGEDVAADLLPHLPAPDSRMTRGQRALWLLSADGSLGEDARERLLLSTLRHWSAQNIRAPEVGTWLVASDGRGGPDRSSAAGRLTGLRERVAHVTALGVEDTSTEVHAPDRASVDYLHRALRLLVEEGGPEEAPLLAEANRLRAVIEAGGEEVTLPSWGESVEEVHTLLTQDLTSEEAPPHRRTFALVLQRATVLESAETLAKQAAEPAPEQTSVSVRGVAVTITANGADRRQLDQARRRVMAHTQESGDARTMLWIAGISAVVLFILALLTMQGFLWLLTLCALGGIGLAYHSTQKERETFERNRAQDLQKVDTRISQASEEWRRERARAEEQATTAQADLEEIRRLLAP